MTCQNHRRPFELCVCSQKIHPNLFDKMHVPFYYSTLPHTFSFTTHHVVHIIFNGIDFDLARTIANDHVHDYVYLKCMFSTFAYTTPASMRTFGILFFRIKLQILCRLSHSLCKARVCSLISILFCSFESYRSSNHHIKPSYMAYQLTLVWSNFVKRDLSDSYFFVIPLFI